MSLIKLTNGAYGTLHSFDTKLGIIVVNVPPRSMGGNGVYTYIDQVQYRRQPNGRYVKTTSECLYDVVNIEELILPE